MDTIAGAATGLSDGDIFWMVTVAVIASLITPAMLLVLMILSFGRSGSVTTDESKDS